MGDTDLYGVLGVSKNATLSEIRKAYHRLARQYHPDKGGSDEEKFKDIQTAYDILSDSQKREMYDRYGMDGVKDGGDPGPSMFSEGLFSHLFGDSPFGFHGMGRRRRPRAETIGIPLVVTLEDVYSGTTKYVEYKRKVLCKTCDGSGSKHNTVVRCRKCQGTGIQVSHRPIGPGMVQQIQSSCNDCNGSGDFIREKDRCKKCKGKRVLDAEEKLEVAIAPGMRHNQKIPFKGKADEIPDGDPGDVLVILQEEDHPVFKRTNIDLIMEKKITLQEALCGCEFTVNHLDGQQLLVKTQPGDVIAPDSLKGVREWGMPQFRHTDIKGNLYIKFEVVFPESGFQADLEKLKSLLPHSRKRVESVSEEAEEVDMIEFEGTKGSEGDHRGEAYDNDDDDEGPPRGHSHVGCSQQ